MSNKKSKIFFFFLFIILLIPLFYEPSLFNYYNQTNSVDKPFIIKYKTSTLTESNPITISSDNDLITQANTYGWTGTGSINDPYVIENLQIINNSDSIYGISVSGLSSKHLLIKNNYIEMTGLSSRGISLSYVDNLVSIYNNTLFNNTQYAIYLTGAYNNVTNNLISDNYYGIYLSVSSYNSITSNRIENNDYGITHSSSCSYNYYYNNTFFNNSQYGIVSFSFYEYNNVIGNKFISNNYAHSFNSFTSYNNFSDNYFEDNIYGIRFNSGSDYNNIFNNTFVNNSEGLSYNVGRSWVFNNTFLENTYALNIYSYYGLYQNNTMMNNGYGIYVSDGLNSSFIDNNIINNSNGIYFSYSANNNTFYGNNFFRNGIQGYSNSGTNLADNGTFGNFWLDHLGIDSNSDGILDTPYTLSGSGGVVDNYPLSIWNNESFSPEIINYPTNLTYETHSMGNNLTWRILDESPDKYELFFNGTSQENKLFNSREFFNVSVNGLDLGKTNVTITFRDNDLNNVSKTIFVTVIDTVKPNITFLSNVSFKEGSLDSFLNWTFTDFHPYNYSLLIDGVVNSTGLWNNSNYISVNVSHLLKGLYNFTMIVQDTSLNINTSVLIVDIYDATPPLVTNYGNQTFEGGLINQTINWTAMDYHPAYYEIYNNSVLIANNSWVSNVNISQLISTLELGSFNFSIRIFDDSGNNVTDTIYITIEDTTSPQVVVNPTNSSYLVSTTGHSITWTVMDFFPSNYTLLVNDTIFLSSIWNNDSLTLNIDGLSIGLNNLTIIFRDTTGNYATDTVWIIVALNDTTPPIITNQTANSTYAQGSVGNKVSWTATDNYAPGNYTLFMNGSLYSTNTWTNNTALIITIDGLTTGLHNLTIVFNDTSGNNASSTIWVTVVADTMNPVIINQPTNSSYLFVSSGNNISWIVIDDIAPGNYSLFNNGALISSNSWINNTVLVVNIDGMAIGLHNLTIVFNDSSGNKISSTVWVTVFEDTLSPFILNQPSNASYFFGSTGNVLSWIVVDNLAPGNYSLIKNGTVDQNAFWVNNTELVINIDGLAIGLYNLTIVFNDTSGNFVSATVWITIAYNDNIAPVVISQSGNKTIQDISTNNYLFWIATDEFQSGNYTLYNTNDVYASGSWVNNTAVIIDIDGLSIGLHNMTMVFKDKKGNEAKNTVWVTVFSDTAPPALINQPVNGTYQQGTTGNSVSWTVIDDLGSATYALYNNGTLLTTNTWTNNTIVTVNIDGLTVGIHNLTIVFKDTSDNIAKQTIWITVFVDPSSVDTTAPVIAGLEEYSYIFGTTGNKISLNATDLHPVNYQLVINGTLNKTATWTSNELIVLELDTLQLPVGVYNLTFIISDSFGNKATHSIIVTVEQENITTTTNTTPTQKTSSTKQTTNSAITQTASSWSVYFLLISFVSMFFLKKKMNFR